MLVAAWQCTPGPGDVAGNLARLADACTSAAAAGVSVLVTPEMLTTGYAVGPELVRALAEPADGPTCAAVAALAAAHGLTIVYGYPELDGSTVYNSANVVTPAGLVATHRKVHLWGIDYDQFTVGPTAPAGFLLGSVAAGALICFDVEFPEAVRTLAVGGARLLLVPTANPTGCDEVQDVLLRARALESGVAIVYANYAGADTSLSYNGRSMIVDADGSVRAVASVDTEELLIASVTLDAPLRVGYLDSRRPDLYG